MADDKDPRATLRSKCQLGLVFIREELKEFPSAIELFETIIDRLDRLETGSFPKDEEPTKPDRRTPPLGVDMGEVLSRPIPKQTPTELRSASGSFRKATSELRETLIQTGKKTQEIPEQDMEEILRKHPTQPGLGGKKDP